MHVHKSDDRRTQKKAPPGRDQREGIDAVQQYIVPTTHANITSGPSYQIFSLASAEESLLRVKSRRILYHTRIAENARHREALKTTWY